MASLDSPLSILREERDRVLGERLRIALWLSVVTTPLFAVVEIVTRATPFFSVYDLVTLAQLVFLSSLLLFLDRPWLRRHLLACALVLTIELSVVTAWAGILRQDSEAAPVMLVLVTMASSIMFPWGARAQFTLALLTSLSLFWNLGAVLGVGAIFAQPITWALEIGFGTSVIIAYWLEQSRRRVAVENFERRQAQRDLREAHARLERRVEERTHSLTETNRRLQNEIVEREKAERNAQLALAAAKSASRAKSQLLANMSHELRTPLSAVIGAMDMLLDTDLGSSQRDLARMARRGGKSLLRLIGDLLDLSKVEAGKLTLRISSFALGELGEHLMQAFLPAASAKNVALRLEVDPRLPGFVHGDPERIAQVLNNFLSNAVKFTERGEVLLAITSSEVECQSLRVRFVVRDTGIGIPPADRGRVFEPFVQVDGSNTRSRDGAGLGLAICRELVEVMNGSIGIEEAPGGGSEFWFEIPLTSG